MTKILLDLLIMFAAAKLFGEIFERLKLPAVVGEILAGVCLGPYFLHIITPTEFYHVLAEIGVIILLFYVGLQTGIDEIIKVGKNSISVAVLGVVLPFILGYAYVLFSGHSTVEGMFIGAAMVATSVGITARVMADLNVLDKKVSKVILAAAVADDIIGMIVLAIVTGMEKGTLSYLNIILVILEAVGFVIFLMIIGHRVIKRVTPKVDSLKTRNAPFAFAIILCLALSVLAGYIKLAAIVGAFMAGMILSEFNIRFSLSSKMESLYDFLVPFFFVVMGANVDLTVFGKWEILGLALILTFLAVIGKLVGCSLGAINLGFKQATIIGVGMVPRGEVGMIIASIGLSLGTVSRDLYSVVIFMVVMTTILTPPILRMLLSRWKDSLGPSGKMSAP
ncbi:MAG: cation:proton antiporter [candidate division Zixibacteria bacterium]|nr:cation:proton antiporter [candidate division Zixibacteria bacterium]